MLQVYLLGAACALHSITAVNCTAAAHDTPRSPAASCILLWAGGTREWKVLSSPAPSQAAILVLQETMSEQDRRLLLLRTSVLRLAAGHGSGSRKRQSEPLGFPWPRGLPWKSRVTEREGPGAALRAPRRAELGRLKARVSSLPCSRPRELHPRSTYRRPNLSCAPADGEQRLSKQELVRQQIAQETFPNELEGLVPLPRAAALPACLARQRLVWRGTRTPFRGEQRSSAGSGAGKVSSAHLLLCQQGQAVKEGMLSLPEELAMGDAAGEHRPACDGGSRLVAKLLGAVISFDRLLHPRVRGCMVQGKMDRAARCRSWRSSLKLQRLVGVSAS